MGRTADTDTNTDAGKAADTDKGTGMDTAADTETPIDTDRGRYGHSDGHGNNDTLDLQKHDWTNILFVLQFRTAS